MLKSLRKKSTHCSAEEVRFLLLLCFGREPRDEVEVGLYSDHSFFASLKRLLARPAFASSLFAPLSLGRHPMQVRFSNDQARLIQRNLKKTLGLKVPENACYAWPQALATSLEATRMQKAFLWTYNHERLAYLQEKLAIELPQIKGAGYHDGVDLIHGYAARSDSDTPLTLEFFMGGKMVGTTVADKPSPEQSAQFQLPDNVAFQHMLDLGEVDRTADAILLIFDQETGVMICPPRDMILDARVSNGLLAQTMTELAALRSAVHKGDSKTVKKAITALERQLPRLQRFADIPLEDYPLYKTMYQPAPDAIETGAGPKIAIVVAGQISPVLHHSLQAQTYTDFEVVDGMQRAYLTRYDIVIPLQGNEELHGQAFQCFASAALGAPNAKVMMAGSDEVSATGIYSNPVFRADFDPLLLEQIPGYASAFAVRTNAIDNSESLHSTGEFLGQLYREYGETGFVYLDDILVSVPEQKNSEPARLTLPAPQDSQKLAIIIPTRDRLDLLKPCVESLKKTIARPESTEIIIVDNGSSDPDTLAWLRCTVQTGSHDAPCIRVLQYAEAFNWAAINNYAVENCDADLLLFLNNDTLAIDKRWDETLRSTLAMQDVGAVGARLLFEDNSLQHGGIIIGPTGDIRHEGFHQPKDATTCQHRLQVTRRCEAVTGAFLACDRTDFDLVGGFDGSDFAVTYNDIDFCLSLSAHNRSVIYTPLITFYHLESRSRGYDVADMKKQRRKQVERARFLEKWPSVAKGDRWFPHQLRYGDYGSRILIKSPAGEPGVQ